MSKKGEAASAKEQGEPAIDSVFDFLYHDSRRIGSFLSQFDESGLLTGITPEGRHEARRMKAGIGVDNWKLPVFRKRLTEAGYSYEDAGPLTGDTTLLTVETDNMFALKKVLEDMIEAVNERIREVFAETAGANWNV